MKVGILAGGKGSRLAEESVIKPKPLVEIGGKPIIWHIMMHYAHYGFSNFVIAIGYKGEVLKKHIIDYTSLNGNLVVNLRSGKVESYDGARPDWIVELIETGMETMTGGRIKRQVEYQELLRSLDSLLKGLLDTLSRLSGRKKSQILSTNNPIWFRAGMENRSFSLSATRIS